MLHHTSAVHESCPRRYGVWKYKPKLSSVACYKGRITRDNFHLTTRSANEVTC